MSYKGSGNMRRTLLCGSEEDLDVMCDPCHFEDQRAEAKGYCLNCKDNLCNSCIKVHTKLSVLREHVIQRNVRSEQSHRTSTGRRQPGPNSDPLSDRCPKHPEEIINLYCNTHNNRLCVFCVPLEHKDCDDCSYIRNVSSGFTNCDEMKTFLEELRHIEAILKFSKSRAQCKKQNIAERYSKALGEIEGFKEEIVKYLNELVDDLRSNASDLHDNAVKASEEENDACDVLLQVASDLYTRSSMGLDDGSHVAVKRKKALSDLKKNAKYISSNIISTPRFVFQRNGELNGLLSSCNTLGKVVVTSEPTDVKYLYDIQASSDISRTACFISRIGVLPDNRLVINDNKNKSVSVINSRQHNFEIKTVTMDSTPIDLAVFNDDKVAVTLKDKRYLQVLSLMPSLSEYYTINVSRLNAGIAYMPDVFLLLPQSSENEKTIHVCDTSGILLKTINTNLIDPWYIAVSPDKAAIYVSDHKGNSLDCININGMRISSYTDKNLENPCGIAMDDDGVVYICSDVSHAVYQLPPTLLNSKKIVSKEQGMVYPMAIAYSDGRLYISCKRTGPNIANFIKVFEIV